MNYLISLLFTGLAVMLSAYLVPGVKVSSFGTSLIVALVLSVLNAFIKPVLMFLTLPINILTLGLFSVIVNVIIVSLASAIVPGFKIEGFFAAVLFVVILSLVSTVAGLIK